MMLHILPDQQGQNKINNALGNKDSFILMVLNGKAISLSKITSPQVLPFYVGDNNRAIKVAEEIIQKKLVSQ
ncbi:hypothetical protein H9V85_004084 [Salmonella enterica subsp. enterica serovar Louisiana]|uniref:Uncharacterized protein n=3 Tax=Salmonella enterica TaxID=28901 RepID=A0A743YF02_SALER|nr:hypothetical protein [Salmonella enterica]EBG0215103.1 hypothetical protein [Salmonella enterica subsp. enterica serovar Louisiana]EBS5460895.1 hypothetical protein [Salmonella enterica subsp. enterica serovar Enteritidis]EBS5544077.1 hypothetical protein [Salmonella enterica subsp. enterica serovar Plymouth]EBY3151696.1 hypothetical protein [Salmonella enterica subsp. enterica serovar Teshie]ECA1253157.1 hypothetical protein [Salmonella enterica subsp. enterica serovar Chailey]ECA7544128.